jgi:hypothetical protein
MTKQPDETILPDDYPVYAGYWYLFDGHPARSNFNEITVKALKRYSGAKEIRRCDAVARNLLL